MTIVRPSQGRSVLNATDAYKCNRVGCALRPRAASLTLGLRAVGFQRPGKYAHMLAYFTVHNYANINIHPGCVVGQQLLGLKFITKRVDCVRAPQLCQATPTPFQVSCMSSKEGRVAF